MINCPPNISIDVPAGSSSGMVAYAFPTASSDCPCPGISITLTSGQLSGVAFPLGVTNVCYTAKDSCGNTASCCFKVAVTEEMPCDVKTKGCIKYELLSITQNTAGERTYQIRVTNNCVGRMIYTAFGVPDGLIATKPDNNTVYTAPSGRQYTVSNPNTGPFNSVKFKSLSDSLANGESDVFKYTLPTQANPLFIHVMARQEPKIFSETYLNTFNCQVGTAPRPRSDAGPRLLRVFPNPTSGTLFADLSAREGEQVQVIVFDPQGRRVLEHTVMAEAIPQEIPLPEGLADGLYALEILTADGKREVVRFVVAR